MRIITLNCNGVRAAARKGLFDWLPQQRADVLCLQELKAQPPDLEGKAEFFPRNWTPRFNSALKKGYAGVGIYAKREPDEVLDKLGVAEFDDEGRYLEFRWGRLSVVSLYLPSGSSGPQRQASKDRFLEFFQPRLSQWLASGRDYVLCADWNIAPTQKDLKNWKSNQKNSGFLPHEREWIAQVHQQGWVDAHRHLAPEAEGELYTWWSNRGNAWANNVGWRLDYQLVTPSLAGRIKSAHVYKDQRFSDHAPLIVDYQA
ncbi:MAG: exodeoxyribonuclease III [Panacagrimonas sp.]